MILSISERTDIVAFYMPWFMNRLKEGYVDVRNPFYPKQVSRIELTAYSIDAIVFCTKNPIAFLEYVDEIPYPYILQVTITPYLKEIEPYVPSKKEIIKALKIISKKIGKERVYLRYDPIFISEKYSISYHEKMFEKICSELKDSVSRVIISFLDLKQNTLKNIKVFKMLPLTKENIIEVSSKIGSIGKKYNLEVSTCGENIDLSEYNILKKGCTTLEDINKIVDKRLSVRKNTTREHCGCIETVDIGAYNCCSHFCKYCYANYEEEKVIENMKQHNLNSSLIIGELETDDIIKLKNKS